MSGGFIYFFDDVTDIFILVFFSLFLIIIPNTMHPNKLSQLPTSKITPFT